MCFRAIKELLKVCDERTETKSYTLTVCDGCFLSAHRLVGLVVKVSALGAKDPGFESRWRRDFSGSSHTSDLKNGTPVATLPGALAF